MKIHVYKIINMIDFNNIGVKANTVMNFSCIFWNRTLMLFYGWCIVRSYPREQIVYTLMYIILIGFKESWTELLLPNL